MINDIIVETLIKGLDSSQQIYNKLVPYNRGASEQPNYVTSGRVSGEQKQLAEMARVDFPGLVAKTSAQPLSITGITDSTGAQVETHWEWWNKKLMPAIEYNLYLEAFRYGESYLVMEKVFGNDDKLLPKGMNKVQGFFVNPFDEFPLYAVEELNDTTYRIWDETYVYNVSTENSDNNEFKYSHKTEPVEHGYPNVPVIRFYCQMDITGRTVGEIEPNIDLFKTVNMKVFAASLNLFYQSYQIRWATGIQLPTPKTDGNGNTSYPELAQFEKFMGQSSMLFSQNPEAKFGALPFTPHDGFVLAIKEAVKMLASVTQTTPSLLLADGENVKAAVGDLISSSNRYKLNQYQRQFGFQYKTLMKLAFPDTDTWKLDFEWKNIDNVSISAITDALGKQAQMLNAPKKSLWKEIPGMTPTKLGEWNDAWTAENDYNLKMTQAVTAYNQNEEKNDIPFNPVEFGTAL